ncbi:hypothetical protein [Novosphingobium sp. 9]|uniref:hypothetical protein n=1 Tax=Novosphingobium sp. 9 TaxID=2025349 RepID=UPI0021B5D589|nr:hypothetical protein [Novosphingobium sp. 9]
MHWQNLIDGPSALIVVGGTLAATLLRCGFADCGAALGGLRALLARRFDTERTRAELASHIREIRQDGLIRAQPRHLGDAEIDDVTDALIGTRSIAGLQRAHEAHKQRRAEASARAVRTLNQASDLSPVFGLAGTLVSLSQLSSAGGSIRISARRLRWRC